MNKETLAYIIYEVMKQRNMTREQAEQFIIEVFKPKSK